MIKPILLFISLYITTALFAQSNTVTDIEGNVYKTVKIGSQLWMAENLRTTHYNDGRLIPNITKDADWDILTTAAYCNYKNTTNIDSIITFGRLYNWYTVSTDNVCPLGWHVPTAYEFDTLQNYLIKNGYNYDGTIIGNKIAKSLASKTQWDSLSYIPNGYIGKNPTANNKSGFNALPSGSRWGGIFVSINEVTIFWGLTDSNSNLATQRELDCEFSGDFKTIINTKTYGESIRCLNNITSS